MADEALNNALNNLQLNESPVNLAAAFSAFLALNGDAPPFPPAPTHNQYYAFYGTPNNLPDLPVELKHHIVGNKEIY